MSLLIVAKAEINTYRLSDPNQRKKYCLLELIIGEYLSNSFREWGVNYGRKNQGND
jgi:hypothetical protein